ncbi:ATE1 [Mytilus edulis]|uniref:arginyltransferase n=1 Tax=Mytilus edulis TaxID=6550 RepID=A0A8S3SE28_MYTED|nr:ATE1 [Mytilus edulis]
MASKDSYGIVEWYGNGNGHRCGYCKSPNGNISDGMWAHALTVQNYQDLIDRGWRRSGKYCYKPLMNKTCCPHYTIKMEALNFRMNKSHKKIIKQVNKYLIHGIKPGEVKGQDQDGARDAPHLEAGNVPEGETPTVEGETTPGVENTETLSPPKPETMKDCSMDISKSEEASKSKKEIRKGQGADPNKPPCRKAKDIRMELKKKKLLAAGKDPQEVEEMFQKKNNSTDGVKTLEDYLNEPSNTEKCAHKLEIKLVRSNPRSQEFEDSFKESHSVYHSYQMKIHGDPPSKPSEAQYTRFLCDSPLEETKGEDKTHGRVSMGYGSFHQHYILDGKIIAVGVVDILPHCISSVYLYYHPDYSFLALGTYTALHSRNLYSLTEIAFTRSLNKMDQELKYYYMGYYIHSCPKMVYKGQYYPSLLLCPETYTWQPIEKCRPKLDQNRYSRLAPEGVEDENLNVPDDQITILFMRQLMNYTIYTQLNPKAKDAKAVKKILISQAAVYFKSEEGGERILCVTFGFFFLVLAMGILVIDEKILEFGLEPGYQNFSEGAESFLKQQGIDSQGPITLMTFKIILAIICSITGALLTFPGLRYAKVHLDTLNYKTLGNYSWSDLAGENAHNYFEGKSMSAQAMFTERGKSTGDAVSDTTAQFTWAVSNLRQVFSPTWYRGLFGFLTWWMTTAWFTSTTFGLYYYSRVATQ